MDKYLLLNRGVLQPQGMDNLKLVVAQIEKDTENNPLFYEDFFSDPPRKWEPRRKYSRSRMLRWGISLHPVG